MFYVLYFKQLHVVAVMADTDKRHYNLCPCSNLVHFPVQIHMASDSEFGTKLSENQQNSDVDDSVSSDLNCSVIVESLDDEQTPSTQNKVL